MASTAGPAGRPGPSEDGAPPLASTSGKDGDAPPPPPPPPPGSPPSKARADRDFSAFPHPPYACQTDFMQALYDTLELGGVGLFESPTGTGKTLSLLVGALTWLEDKRAAEAAADAAGAAEAEAAATAAAAAAGPAPPSDLPPWLAVAAAAADGVSRATHAVRRAARVARARERVAAAKAAAAAAAARAGGDRLAWAELGRGRGGGGGATARQPARRPPAADDDAEGLDADFLISDEEDGRGGGGARLKRGRAAPPLSPPASDTDDDDDDDVHDLSDRDDHAADDDEEDRTRGPGGSRLPLNRVRPGRTQVIIASRTHSQLAQFVGELNRTRFGSGGGGGSGEGGGSGGRAEEGPPPAPPPPLTATAVALGSRAALCINEAVRGLGSAPRMAEACRDLATRKGAAARVVLAGGEGTATKKAASSSSCGCPHRRPAPASRRALADAMLAAPLDVEALAEAGRAAGACPYYAARDAAAHADVIFLPYAALLSDEARASLGVRLRGAVVIIDEAHNLPAAVAGAYGATVTGEGLGVAAGALREYLRRYGPRLGPGTRREVQTLLAMADGLARLLVAGQAGGSGGGGEAPSAAAAATPPPPPAVTALTVDAASSCAGIDNVNGFRLVASLRERKVVPKVAGAAAAAAARAAREAAAEAGGGAAVLPGRRRAGAPAAADADAAAAAPTPTAALHALVSFVAALTTADDDGRVIVTPPGAAAGEGGGGGGGSGDAPRGGSLRFALLNAGARFAAVLSAARAVVLASGTLEPSASLEAQLFPGGVGGRATASTTRALPLPPPQPVTRFACGHVLPPHRLLALAVGSGPTGATLDLRHASRATPATLDEMGRLLLNVCGAVPAGVVAFFPSFAHMGAAVTRWRATGTLAALARRKPGGGAGVAVEPRGAGPAAAALAAYAAAAPAGALLLGVIGGKLSEGINFGDALGRGVVVFGLPYPNPSDPELKERMAWLDGPKGPGRGAGRRFYTDAAAVAVNQTVGRVVRHARDWAAVVLADARYATTAAAAAADSGGGGGSGGGGAASRLPAWMRPSLKICSGGYGEAHGALARFCKARAREDAGQAGGGGGSGGGA